MKKSVPIAPKMAQLFADLAKQGKADSIHEFDQGNQVITLITLDPPVGYVRREVENTKNFAQRLRIKKPNKINDSATTPVGR